MQIFDNGELVPMSAAIENIVRAVLGVSGELNTQQQGMLLLHFSQEEAHLTTWKKNIGAEIRKRRERRPSRF